MNQLLSELTPLDPRQLFICHKQAFYAAYRGWSEETKAYVADLLVRSYASDKAATRETLYGGPDEPPAAPPSVPASRPRTVQKTPELIDLVGPWGAVKRS